MRNKITFHILSAAMILTFFSMGCFSCTDNKDNSVSTYFPSGEENTPHNADRDPVEGHDMDDMETSPLVRTTCYGKLKGTETKNNTYAWLGIPFARPPVGDLRWRAPLSPEPWEGVRSAADFCSYCPQYGNLLSETGKESFGKLTGDEDCLYLNIWRPASNETQLPVFVFIYGGGNYIGRSDVSLYDGANFAARSNMIVVTLNYRLGALGWFSHPSLYNGDPLDDSGNYGTLDIIKALEWVHENIEAFGGNPDNVTISGQSSGAIHVYAMLTSPLAAGLFHKAIAMSGFPLSCTREFAEERSERILERLLKQDHQTVENGVVFDNTGVRASDSVASYLRSRSLEDLFNPDYAMFMGLSKDGGVLSTLLRMGTTVDGVVMPGNMMESLQTAQYNTVPVIIGNTTEEIKLFLPMVLAGDAVLFDLIDTFDPDNPDLGLLDILKPRLWPFLSVYNPMNRLATSIFQDCGVDKTADILSQYQDVYVYQFGWNDQPKPFGFYIGAGHAVDVPFVFGNFITDRPSLMKFAWSEENKDGREVLSHDMMTYYARFARTGTPNTGNDEMTDWPPWDDESKENPRMIFDAGGAYLSFDEVDIEGTPDIDTLIRSLSELISVRP